MPLHWLDPNQPEQAFPDLDQALEDPNGLIAIEGCLSAKRLINAYRAGIFPWYNENEPILWWSPDPRLVIFPNKINISRSLAKTLRKPHYEVRFDTAFESVIQACSNPRKDAMGTWISDDIQKAYIDLHRLGIAHCVETWEQDVLVGGLYGVSIGRVFFGESMFHTQTDASKVAFVHLVRKLESLKYAVIDCQVKSQHLISLGAEEITRRQFRSILDQHCDYPDAWEI